MRIIWVLLFVIGATQTIKAQCDSLRPSEVSDRAVKAAVYDWGYGGDCPITYDWLTYKGYVENERSKKRIYYMEYFTKHGNPQKILFGFVVLGDSLQVDSILNFSDYKIESINGIATIKIESDGSSFLMEKVTNGRSIPSDLFYSEGRVCLLRCGESKVNMGEEKYSIHKLGNQFVIELPDYYAIDTISAQLHGIKQDESIENLVPLYIDIESRTLHFWNSEAILEW